MGQPTHVAAALLCLNIFSVAFDVSMASRILMIPSGSLSHLLEMDSIANQLMDRNHDIFVLVESAQREIIQKVNPRYKMVTYTGFTMMKLDNEPDSYINQPMDSIFKLPRFVNEAQTICETVMEDEDMWRMLQSLELDLVIVDNFVFDCSFLIPHRLGVRYVSSGTHVLPHFTTLPLLPSVNQILVSFESFGITVCAESSDCPRLFKSIRRFLEYCMVAVVSDSGYLRPYANYSSIKAVRLNVSLAIINLDHIMEDDPMPQLPGVEYVGGLTTRAPKPLSAELDKWMNDSGCVVVANFGTRVANVESITTQKLLDAFGGVRCNVLYRCVSCDELKIPSNVRIVSWLAQNDALAHPNAKVFVTHSGNNGQYEALYHGVPMAAFYVDGDQIRNSRRVERKGFGKRLSLASLDSQAWSFDINELIENTTYKKTIARASDIFRSYDHPAVRAADAVERVMKFGNTFPIDEMIRLSAIEYYCVDVIFSVFSIFVILSYIALRVSIFILRRVFKF